MAEEEPKRTTHFGGTVASSQEKECGPKWKPNGKYKTPLERNVMGDCRTKP